MDYEEKYKKVLEKIQGLLDGAKRMGHIIVRVEDIENTFPELVESEDEKIRNELIEYFNAYPKDYFCELKKSHILAWFEKQGEQKEATCVAEIIDRLTEKEQEILFKELEMQKVQKPVWSEEDEEYLRRAIKATKEVFPVTSDWLKSIKQRIGWKPSEKQMKALHDLNLTGNISYAGQGQVLIELYNDLKKLKENSL